MNDKEIIINVAGKKLVGVTSIEYKKQEVPPELIDYDAWYKAILKLPRKQKKREKAKFFIQYFKHLICESFKDFAEANHKAALAACALQSDLRIYGKVKQ